VVGDYLLGNYSLRMLLRQCTTSRFSSRIARRNSRNWESPRRGHPGSHPHRCLSRLRRRHHSKYSNSGGKIPGGSILLRRTLSCKCSCHLWVTWATILPTQPRFDEKRQLIIAGARPRSLGGRHCPEARRTRPGLNGLARWSRLRNYRGRRRGRGDHLARRHNGLGANCSRLA
jgi:hypothetical protein